MAAESGYGKISTSGLTFGYDVGETRNSFKGKPTTNYVANASTMANFGNYSCGTPVTFTTEFGTTGYRMANLGSWNGVVMGGISLPSTGTYTFSAYIRYIGGSPNNNGGTVYTSGFGLNDTAAYHNKSIVGEWFRLSNTQNCTGTNGTFYLISYGGTYCDDYSSWEVTMPQIEAGSAATQWVDGARSSTQGLLDIIGNSTLDLSNVSFDANTQMTFDGTNDYVSVTLPSSISVYCLEMVWYNNNAIPNNDTAIGGPTTYQTPIEFNGNGQGVHLGAWTGGLTNEAIHIWGPYGVTSNRVYAGVGYHHVVFNWNGTTYDIWVDGVNTTTYYGSGTDYATLITATSIKLGNDVSGYCFNGQIPITKIYNRALTASEALSNYQHYRSRFSLPAVKDGSTESLAAPSAQYLADIGIKANGVYWINNGTTTKQTYCEFKNGEGWMLVMNIKSDYYGDSYLSWNDYNNWINDGDELGNPQLPYVGLGQYRNRDIFRYCPTTKWMIKVHNNGTEFGDGSWGAWQINSTYSGQTFEQIMNIPGATGGGTQISSTYYAQEGMGTTTYARGLDYCSIARTLGHLRVNHLLDNNGVRILGNEQTLETANNDVTRGIGQIYDIAGTALTNQAYAQYNTHIGPYVNGSTPFTGNRRQFTDQLFPDNSNYNAARGEGLNVNPSLTYGGSPAMIAYYHYAIFIK